MMKVIKLGFCTLILSLMLTSCEDEGLLGGLVGDNDNNNESFFGLFAENDDDDSLDISCVEFVYPLTLTFPDGTTSTVNNEGELEQAINTATSTGDFPTINFPIQVIGDNELPVSVADEEALCELFEECFEEEEDCECGEEDECFEINYPITIVLPDGSNVTVNDDEALENAIDDYYDLNPNDSGDVTLIYPITVTMFEDSSTVVINNDDDLDDLLEDCYGDDDFEECFDIQFPISIAMPDGSTIVTNTYEELDSLYEAWDQANPNATNEPELVFPITVILEDGTTQVINNEDELEGLLEDCFDHECEMVRGTDVVLGASDASVGRMVLKKSKITAKQAKKASKN